MSSDNPDAGSPGERTKRAPPTIDLDPSEVTENGKGPRANEDTHGAPRDRSRPWFDSVRGSSFDNASGALTPALSGATAAALILTGAWLLGLSGDNRAPATPAVATAPAAPADTSATDALAARMAKIEADAAAAKTITLPQPVSDPAVLARVDQIETSLKSVNDALAGLRGELERVAAAKDIAPRDGSAAAIPDLSAFDQRFARIEAAQRTLGEATQRSVAPPDDRPLRRVVAASALDLAVRQGGPFAPALAAAKAVAPDAALQALDAFAASGVPSDAVLSRELLLALPQLAPQQAKQPAAATTSVIDRLQESAAKLVRVERVDAASESQPSPATTTIATAARANDVAAARRALMDMPAAQRAPAQAWLDKVAARDAAREAARQFASDALAALGKPAQ